jgi:hypothetical protein
VLDRSAHEELAWCTTLRFDGSPHTTPVWFCFIEGSWWIASAARSVKGGARVLLEVSVVRWHLDGTGD